MRSPQSSLTFSGLGFIAFLAFLLLLASAGCGTIVKSRVSTFHRLPSPDEGKTFVVLPADKKKEGSIEFDSYARLVATNLSARGYREVSTVNEQPDYVVFLDYAIDSGQTVTGTVPIFGQTGGGTTYHSGTVTGSGGYGSYSGHSYTPPTYGIVGAVPYSHTYYSRYLTLDIFDAKGLAKGSVEKVYEGRVVSAGANPSLAEIVPYMVKAIFVNFPGKSGEIRTVEFPRE